MISVRHCKIREAKIEVLATHCFNTIEALVHAMSLKISVLMYQCFNVLPIEVVLMIVVFLQLAYAHKPKSPSVI
jgi:hypothetical protein